jgi:cobalt-zinc-cadmium efflux system protein
MAHPYRSQIPFSHRNRNAERRRLTLALILVATYMVAEAIGGLLTGSLALLADAGHMLSDAASLGLALFALWLAGHPATSKHTWGYYRTEILAALVNGAALVTIALFVFFEAYSRFLTPVQINSGPMILIATGGLGINLGALFLLREGSSLNIRGARIHVLTDTLGSLQAIAAGILIWLFEWNWVDPLVSVLIGVLVIFSSWSLLEESVIVLMESSPVDVNVDDVRGALADLEGVLEVHDLHIWTITSGLVALSAHVVCRADCDRDLLLAELGQRLRKPFRISHTTIQIESQEYQEERPLI